MSLPQYLLPEVRNIKLGFFTCKWLNKYRFFLSVWPGWPSSLPGVCGPVRQAACSGGPWRSSTTPWPLECLGSRNLELSQWWCAGVPPPWSEINWPCYNSHSIIVRVTTNYAWVTCILFNSLLFYLIINTSHFQLCFDWEYEL